MVNYLGGTCCWVLRDGRGTSSWSMTVSGVGTLTNVTEWLVGLSNVINVFGVPNWVEKFVGTGVSERLEVAEGLLSDAIDVLRVSVGEGWESESVVWICAVFLFLFLFQRKKTIIIAASTTIATTIPITIPTISPTARWECPASPITYVVGRGWGGEGVGGSRTLMSAVTGKQKSYIAVLRTLLIRFGFADGLLISYAERSWYDFNWGSAVNRNNVPLLYTAGGHSPWGQKNCLTVRQYIASFLKTATKKLWYINYLTFFARNRYQSRASLDPRPHFPLHSLVNDLYHPLKVTATKNQFDTVVFRE